jgi:hypothetical protein
MIRDEPPLAERDMGSRLAQTVGEIERLWRDHQPAT